MSAIHLPCWIAIQQGSDGFQPLGFSASEVHNVNLKGCGMIASKFMLLLKKDEMVADQNVITSYIS